MAPLRVMKIGVVILNAEKDGYEYTGSLDSEKAE